MGSLCSKSTSDDAPPARPSNINTLGGNSYSSAPSSTPAKKFTAKQKPKITGPGRTLGGGASSGGGGGNSAAGGGGQSVLGGAEGSSDRVDARSAAAIAAAAREDAAKAKIGASKLRQKDAAVAAAGNKQTGADELAYN